MAKPNNETTVQIASARERLLITSDVYISTKSIAKLMGRSITWAGVKKREIMKIKHPGKHVTPGGNQILTSDVMEYFGLTDDMLKECASREDAANQSKNRRRISK